MQPTADGFQLANRPRLASQQEESGLKRVLGILDVFQHSAAHAQHHRAVALQQGGKGPLILFRCKAFQEIPVARLCVRFHTRQCTHVLYERIQVCVSHTPGSREAIRSSYHNVLPQSELEFAFAGVSGNTLAEEHP
jgi:hypothetical protein